ncbi:twin-arginine translocase TatA/TatE family subunit [Chloroflexota bacterium]
MRFGIMELIILLVVIILILGPGRIGKIAGEIGSGIRSFREGLKSAESGNEANSDNVNKDQGHR